MNKLLPQANNLDTVIDVFMYIYFHPGCTKESIADYCGFTLRQVEYYTNACEYLDLINEDWTPTALGKDICARNASQIRERIYERIISDELIGKIFAKRIIFPDYDILPYAISLAEEYCPGYSEPVYTRRAGALVKWVDKIIKDTL